MSNEINLDFGILAKPLEEQLKDKGYALKNIKKYDLCVKGISALYVHGYLTASEREKSYKKLMKDLKRDIKDNLIQIEM